MYDKESTSKSILKLTDIDSCHTFLMLCSHEQRFHVKVTWTKPVFVKYTLLNQNDLIMSKVSVPMDKHCLSHKFYHIK